MKRRGEKNLWELRTYIVALLALFGALLVAPIAPNFEYWKNLVIVAIVLLLIALLLTHTKHPDTESE